MLTLFIQVACGSYYALIDSQQAYTEKQRRAARFYNIIAREHQFFTCWLRAFGFYLYVNDYNLFPE